jgi:septal ring factor EnvC (AmiA/AmiB activator)
MSSLRPKESGSYVAPPPPPRQATWIPVALIVAIIAIAAVAFGEYSTKSSLESRIAGLELEVQQVQDIQKQDMKKLQGTADSLASDMAVVSKKIGVTTDELKESRQVAEKLRQEQDRQAAAREQLAKELATKANTTDVAAAREEAASKVAEAQKSADTKIGTVSNDVKTVATNLEATNRDLAESKRALVDVKTTLAEQIAHNSSEISDLRKKGERDYVEFDIKKGKKGVMTRVADIQLELTDTDPKKNKYSVIIQVDDNRLEKKDLSVNQPVQFLVGREKLRYEIVVNVVDKDRIRGYMSAPKDKALSAERPAFK